MKFCPKKFGHDMTDPGNLDYCRSIQDENRCKGCRYRINNDNEIPEEPKQPTKSAPIAKRLF